MPGFIGRVRCVKVGKRRLEADFGRKKSALV